MSRTVLLAILPWLGLLLGSLACLLLLIRLSTARFEWRRLLSLHEDQAGSAQALSFVLTLPLFVWFLMVIVQVSQLMIGRIVVEYAALAAARSAVVWLPAKLDDASEPANCIGPWRPDPDVSAPDAVLPTLLATDEDYGPIGGGRGGRTYPLTAESMLGSPKYQKIKSAAVTAVMPICPSRDLGLSLPPDGSAAAGIIQRIYHAMVPSSNVHPEWIDRRIRNKLAYAMEYTSVEMRVFHPNQEPPLDPREWPPDSDSLRLCPFRPNEYGWQDTITVTVTHQMALLPGPGSLLFRWRMVGRPDGSPDTGAQKIRERAPRRLYTYPLTASATLGNEGEESVIPYEYHVY